MQRGIEMRKPIVFAVVALIVTCIGTWIGVRTFAHAGSPPVAMTGAKSPAHHDDYDLVVH